MNELSALFEAFAGLDDTPSQSVEYRLYYDNEGRPVTMSSSDFPVDGKYLVIDRETYDNADYTVRVKDSKIVKMHDSMYHYHALTTGPGFRVVKGHANILVDETYQGETETYDFKNH